jgi:hypothetical protein
MFGSQTPQWYYVCDYNGRNYFLPQNDALDAPTWVDEEAVRKNIFTGQDMEFYDGHIGPDSWNVFDKLFSNALASSTLDVKNDNGHFRFIIAGKHSTVHELEFFPLDDMLKTKVYPIYGNVSLEYIIPSELATVDYDKYDGHAIVNGVMVKITKYDKG